MEKYTPAPDRYEQIAYRRCGSGSGLKLPLLSLGLWHNFGGVDDPAVARQMILSCFDRGITHFDLANNYGPPFGTAEITFGRVFASDLQAHRDELLISTKAGWEMWEGPYGNGGSRKYLLASLDQSLKRMGLEYVDIFYHHRPDPETPMEESLLALVQAVKQGKALYAGISAYSGEQTLKAYHFLKENGVPLLVNQVAFNLLNRTVASDLAPVLEKTGVGSTIFSPLAQGILTGKYLDGIPAGSRAERPAGFLKPEQVTQNDNDRVRKLAEIAKKRGQGMTQMSLAWILSHPWVSSILLGVRNMEQLDQAFQALNQTQFTPEELAAIAAI